jgi:hypothetical protein
VDAAPERLGIEVLDCGDGLTLEPGLAHADAETSFGLFLLERMSDRWGFDVSEGRTPVWCEVGTAGA